MKRILPALMIVFSFVLNAQAQQVRYKVKKDDPSDFKNLMIHLDPMMIDCYFTDITFGVSARADYMLSKILDVHAQWRKPYWDMNEWSLNDDYNSNSNTGFYRDGGVKTMSWMEGNIQLHFLDRIKSTNHRVVFYKSTSTSGNYQTVTTKFVDLPGHVRKIKSLRGGAYWHNTSVDFGNVFSKEGEWKATPSNGGAAVDVTQGGTMMRSVVVYGGLSGQSIANFKVLTDKYGMKYITPWNTFYVDFMFAPVLNFADVISKADNTTYKIDNANIKRTGWRVGYTMRNHKATNLSFNMSFGVRPGLVGEGGITASRVFFDMNAGVSLPYRASLKPKAKPQS